MSNTKQNVRPKLGMRTIKTAIVCFILAIIYKYGLGNRNPCFALIGAAYACGSQFNEGFRHGLNRSIGTLTGGIVVLVFYCLYYENPLNIMPEIYMAIGLILTIYCNTLFGSTGAIQPAIVVYFVVMFTQPEATFFKYTIDRIIDTFAGAVFGSTFSYLFPSPIDKMKHSNLKTAYRAWVEATKRTKDEIADFYDADMKPRNDSDTIFH